MLVKLAGGRVYDPINGVNGEVRNLWIEDGRHCGRARRTADRLTRVVDVTGRIVMPGGIDIHSHIGGGKVNLARMMLPGTSGHTRSARRRGLPLRQRAAQPVDLQHRLRLRPAWATPWRSSRRC